MGKVLVPNLGWTQNPYLSSKGRNRPCICGSGKKIKKCCGPKLPRYVEKHVVDTIKKDPQAGLSAFWEWLIDKGYATRKEPEVVDESIKQHVYDSVDVSKILEKSSEVPSEEAIP